MLINLSHMLVSDSSNCHGSLPTLLKTELSQVFGYMAGAVSRCYFYIISTIS